MNTSPLDDHDPERRIIDAKSYVIRSQGKELDRLHEPNDMLNWSPSSFIGKVRSAVRRSNQDAQVDRAIHEVHMKELRIQGEAYIEQSLHIARAKTAILVQEVKTRMQNLLAGEEAARTLNRIDQVKLLYEEVALKVAEIEAGLLPTVARDKLCQICEDQLKQGVNDILGNKLAAACGLA